MVWEYKKSDLPEGATLYISDNTKKAIDCVVPHATFAVQTNGNVVGCGCTDWLEKYIIGNVKQNSIFDVWQSDKAIKFRKAFSNGDKLPEICEECGLYTPVTCFKRKELIDYESCDGLYYKVN